MTTPQTPADQLPPTEDAYRRGYQDGTAEATAQWREALLHQALRNHGYHPEGCSACDLTRALMGDIRLLAATTPADE